MIVPNFVFTFQFFNLPRDYMYRGLKIIIIINRSAGSTDEVAAYKKTAKYETVRFYEKIIIIQLQCT